MRLNGTETHLQLCRVVNPVDDVSIVLELRLGAEFAAEELGHV